MEASEDLDTTISKESQPDLELAQCPSTPKIEEDEQALVPQKKPVPEVIAMVPTKS